jgi:hypothetical protein
LTFGRCFMSEQTIVVDGEEVSVREDTAKAYRGVNWMMISISAFVIISAVLSLVFLVRTVTNDVDVPVTGNTNVNSNPNTR